MTLTIAVQLFTAFALLLVTAYMAYVAHVAARRAEHSATQLMQSRARIIALEHSLEALDTKHRKLAGRVYANERAAEPEPEPEQESGQPLAGVPMCDNWRQAQIDGPRSRAANCECGYCEAARDARAQFRAQALPRRANVRAVKGPE